MVTSLAALQTLRPIKTPDYTQRHKTLADARAGQQTEQLRGLQIEGAESDLAAEQAAREKATQIHEVLVRHRGDIEKALPEINQLDPVLGNALAKTGADIAEGKARTQREADSLKETQRHNAATELQAILNAGREASKPQLVPPGTGVLKPGESQPSYSQPFAPKEKTLEQQAAEAWLARNPGKTMDDYQTMDANRRRQMVNVNLERQREIDLENQTNAAPGQIVFASSGRPVPPASVGDAAAKRMADFQSAIGQADTVEKLLANLGSTGAIKGYTLEHGIYWPVVQDNISPEQAEAVSEVQRLSNEYIKAVSGAAVSDQEMQRLARTTPSLKLTAEANKKIVGHFKRYANSQLSNYLKLRGWKLKEGEAAPAASGGQSGWSIIDVK